LSLGLAQAQSRPLSGEEIRTLVTDQRIYLATPLGGELPMNYRASGLVDAKGEAIGLGRFFKPNDKGRWWVSGNRLCQQWESWYSGEEICFTLARKGADGLIWVRDNGEKGLARISRAPTDASAAR
jgi:hypothetical protein